MSSTTEVHTLQLQDGKQTLPAVQNGRRRRLRHRSRKSQRWICSTLEMSLQLFRAHPLCLLRLPPLQRQLATTMTLTTSNLPRRRPFPHLQRLQAYPNRTTVPSNLLPRQPPRHHIRSSHSHRRSLVRRMQALTTYSPRCRHRQAARRHQ